MLTSDDYRSSILYGIPVPAIQLYYIEVLQCYSTYVLHIYIYVCTSYVNILYERDISWYNMTIFMYIEYIINLKHNH